MSNIVTKSRFGSRVIGAMKPYFGILGCGALVQLTAESLTGGFGPESKACARYLLQKKMVHFLASDGHSADWRPPVLSAGVKAATKIVGKDEARKLVFDNPSNVIDGLAIG